MTTTQDTVASDQPGAQVALRPWGELAQLDLSDQFLADYEPLNPEVQATLFAELEEAGIELNLSHLTRVRVPSGKITQFAIDDEDGVEQFEREIIGIPLEVIDRRSFWERDLDDPDAEKGPPDCSSRDGKTGTGLYGVGSERHASGECASCPMNARGSAGTGTQAAKCKAQKLMFLASTLERVPMIVHIPPSGLGPYTKFMVGGAIKRRASGNGGAKEIRITLVKASNPRGIEYAQLQFAATGRQFTADERAVIAAVRARMQVMIKENQEALDAMAAASVGANGESGGTGGAPIPYDEVPDGALPQDEPLVSPTKRTARAQ